MKNTNKMIISHLNITETVYNFLTSLSNTNELYEGENFNKSSSMNLFNVLHIIKVNFFYVNI